MPQPPLITLLTDFGVTDHYIAAMKGVILTRCPEARLVDISHEIKAFAVAEAAFTLGQAYSCFPAGTTHLVVVDPGVGSARRPLVLEADGHRFVAPDNGVLSWPMDRDPEFRAVEITATSFFRHPVSNTFHGRDIFAPVAAHLACGVPAAEFGRRIFDPARLDLGRPLQVAPGVWKGVVLYVDRFGNVVTSFRTWDVPDITCEAFEIVVGSTVVSRYAGCYADGGAERLFVIEGSSGNLEVSINQGNAALATGAAAGSPVILRVTRPPAPR